MRARDHRCDLTDLDYSDVAVGYIRCTVCPRKWVLMVSVNQKTGVKYAKWVPTPCPACDTVPCRCYRPKKATGSTKERWGDDD